MKRVSAGLLGLALAVAIVGGIAAHGTGSAAPGSCTGSLSLSTDWNTACFTPRQISRAEWGLPFAAIDPRGLVKRYAHLRLVVERTSRLGMQHTNGSLNPAGPPQWIWYYFGSVADAMHTPSSVQAVPRYVTVTESQLLPNRGIRLDGTGPWTYTADLPPQRVSIQVDSDGPKSVVGSIGSGLVAAARRLPTPPTRPEQVYVSGPTTPIHAGKTVTFWVLTGWRPNTFPGPSDFGFSLKGAWSRPHTVTPDGLSACGGDNPSGQPFRRHGHWAFDWGDCRELGLVLTPTAAGRHELRIDSYSAGTHTDGTLDPSREKLAPGGGYLWRGNVLP